MEIDFTTIKHLIAEAEKQVVNANKLPAESKQQSDTRLTELYKGIGILTAIINEATLLIGDVKVVSQPAGLEEILKAAMGQVPKAPAPPTGRGDKNSN